MAVRNTYYELCKDYIVNAEDATVVSEPKRLPIDPKVVKKIKELRDAKTAKASAEIKKPFYKAVAIGAGVGFLYALSTGKSKIFGLLIGGAIGYGASSIFINLTKKD